MNPDLVKTNLRNGITDSHFHLFHMKERRMDYLEIINYCFSCGLEAAVDIGINSDNFKERIAAASKIPGLYTAHGYYPSECTAENLEKKLEYLEECLLADSSAVALGEIGYDFFHEYGNENLQTELFNKQIEIAQRLNLPIIVHSRDAEKQTSRLLAGNTPARGGIIHCFSYSPDAAADFTDKGFYISFAGNVTYRKAELIQKSAAAVPLDRLLIETDAPYLSPQQVRSRINHPGYIGYTYEYVAELRNISVEELITAVNRNFKTLFGI